MNPNRNAFDSPSIKRVQEKFGDPLRNAKNRIKTKEGTKSVP